MKKILVLTIVLICAVSCREEQVTIEEQPVPFDWKAANLYFLLVDRFNNGDTSNDINFSRTKETATLRGFKGGDLKGITQKIEAGYFTDLGVNAIWITPIVEQIHDGTDEGTGYTYGFHGYWTKDWTALDPNFGTEDDLSALVNSAHKKGIRIVLDAVINHTGPVTETDSVWPEEWVRTSPKCTYQDYESAITCTLVENLPDIKTESNDNVDLPAQLVEKWKTEGRYEQEVKELDEFFERTGHPRAPRFYIMKWLTDYIVEFGIDGYRVDTVRHVEEQVWKEFKVECDYAFNKWKENNPERVLDNNAFYMVGEVYGYNLSSGKHFDFGDKKVNYFNESFHSLINFELRSSVNKSYEEVFSHMSTILHETDNFWTMSYMTSHDDVYSYDMDRTKPFETAVRLYLAPGTSQTFYGDELARPLRIEGTEGDATLRSFMNWEDVETKKEILAHWQKIGKFRRNNPAVGAGVHKMISNAPYVFSRIYNSGDYDNQVVVGLSLSEDDKELDVSSVFENGVRLKDAYSGQSVQVRNGKVKFKSKYDIVLLQKQ
jgi:alpha-amylase